MVGADVDVLHRLLRALASDGVFAEQERGVFANTPASERMLDASVAAFAHLFGGVFHRTAGALDAGGEPAFAGLYGTDFWTWLGANPTERSAFDRAMGGRGTRTADRLATVEWRGDETVVDAGGGNGALLVELVGRQPGLRGIVLDLKQAGDRDRLLETRLRSAIVSSSSPAASSSACRRVTRTSCRGSSTTGTTRARRGSSARSERPRRPARVS